MASAATSQRTAAVPAKAPGAAGRCLCGADPLVAVPHTSMCMGVDSFTERTGGPHVMWAYISL